ncbi:alpha/beta hydrolase [Nocardia sp. NPDC004722]
MVVAAVAVVAGIALPGSAHADVGVSCRDVELPVVVAGNSYAVYGNLCDPGSGPSATLQVLVHGLVYDHFYWDPPEFGGRYSYVRHAAAAGYSTLAIDRIGSGRSGHPAALDVTALSNADVVHQIVQAARRGDVVHSWSRIVTVGHSFGTVVTEIEAASYRDVDGIIGTSWVNVPGLVPSAALMSWHEPVDSAGGEPLPPGYLTMRSGGLAVFHQPGNVDPGMLAADDRRRGTDTVGEVATPTSVTVVQAMNPIGVPALLVLGEDDFLFCTPPEHQPCDAASVRESQRMYFTAQAVPSTYVQRGAGHSIAHELNAADGFDAMIDWLGERGFGGWFQRAVVGVGWQRGQK